MIKTHISSVRCLSAVAFAIATAACLAFPSVALARVAVDDNELAPGNNSVGGGTATLSDVALDMVNVTAGSVNVDENLTINFNGGNDIDTLIVEESANVEVNFAGDNDVEDTLVADKAHATINANGHNDFEEVKAYDNASVVINVTGENDFETIAGSDNSTITVRGTECQMRDTLNIGDDEDTSGLFTQNGNLTIDHVTVNMESKTAFVGSESGNVTVDTSKIASDDDNEYTEIFAGGTLNVIESVIEITGTMSSLGKMTINHSDVEADAPDKKYDTSPYRVYSLTGIELIREKNGEVKEGELYGEKVWYVDTGDGEDVDLKADGKPGYYKCRDEGSTTKTGDSNNPWGFAFLALASATTAGYAAKRRRDDEG